MESTKSIEMARAKAIAPRKRLRKGLLVGATLVGLLGLEAQAFALQGGEDPALLPVLIDKRFGLGGRQQASLLFSSSFADKFVEATGVTANYQYSFSDLLGVALNGSYFFLSRETSIMREIRAVSGEDPQLSDLNQMQWMAHADLMLVPIYGKMSFASEFDPQFDLFFVGGAGVAGTRRLVSVGASEGFENAVVPVFNLGVGMRFYFSRLMALRLEIRDYFFPDPGVRRVVRAGQPLEERVGGLTWNLHFQAGLQFAFGGE